jgi:RNA polymerase sigma-70 factor (ECF subfamily)
VNPGIRWVDEVALSLGSDLLRFLQARLSSAHDAEDLAQEVYLRLMRVTDNERIRNPRAYVLRVAANVVHEWRLLARNRLVHSAELLDHLPDAQDTAGEADIQRQARELEAALGTLSQKCRAVVLMHRRDHYTYEEIAARLDISVSMVKKYLVKGLSVCQSRVGRDSLATERPLQPGARRNG